MSYAASVCLARNNALTECVDDPEQYLEGFNVTCQCLTSSYGCGYDLKTIDVADLTAVEQHNFDSLGAEQERSAWPVRMLCPMTCGNCSSETAAQQPNAAPTPASVDQTAATIDPDANLVGSAILIKGPRSRLPIRLTFVPHYTVGTFVRKLSERVCSLEDSQTLNKGTNFGACTRDVTGFNSSKKIKMDMDGAQGILGRPRADRQGGSAHQSDIAASLVLRATGHAL